MSIIYIIIIQKYKKKYYYYLFSLWFWDEYDLDMLVYDIEPEIDFHCLTSVKARSQQVR